MGGLALYNWENVIGFAKHEFQPPGGDKLIEFEMNVELIEALQEVRTTAERLYGFARSIIHRNGGFSIKGHAEDSLHYKGRAADFHVEVRKDRDSPWRRISPIELGCICYELTCAHFGLGIYKWGVHLDYRRGIMGRTPAVWFQAANGQYHFKPWGEFYKVIYEAVDDNAELLDTLEP